MSSPLSLKIQISTLNPSDLRALILVSKVIGDVRNVYFDLTSIHLFCDGINISTDSRLTNLERIKKSKLSFLLSSPLTAPSTTFPIYYVTGSTITVNPSSLTSIDIDYISVPSDPVWASTVDSNGALTFDSTGASGVNFVDFTLHPSSEVDLVLEILRYTGVVIKDPSVIQSATAETTQKVQLENS